MTTPRPSTTHGKPPSLAGGIALVISGIKATVIAGIVLLAFLVVPFFIDQSNRTDDDWGDA